MTLGPVPEEARLGELVAMAFEQLPEPEAARITAVLDAVTREASSRRAAGTRPARRGWWLAGLLLAAAAAGAFLWQQGLRAPPERPAAAALEASPAPAPTGPEMADEREDEADGRTTGRSEARDERSPIIYQRDAQ